MKSAKSAKTLSPKSPLKNYSTQKTSNPPSNQNPVGKNNNSSKSSPHQSPMDIDPPGTSGSHPCSTNETPQYDTPPMESEPISYISTNLIPISIPLDNVTSAQSAEGTHDSGKEEVGSLHQQHHHQKQPSKHQQTRGGPSYPRK